MDSNQEKPAVNDKRRAGMGEVVTLGPEMNRAQRRAAKKNMSNEYDRMVKKFTVVQHNNHVLASFFEAIAKEIGCDTPTTALEVVPCLEKTLDKIKEMKKALNGDTEVPTLPEVPVSEEGAKG